MEKRFQCILFVTALESAVEGYALLPRSLVNTNDLLDTVASFFSQYSVQILKNGLEWRSFRGAVRKRKSEVVEISLTVSNELTFNIYGHGQDQQILELLISAGKIFYFSEPSPNNLISHKVDDEDIIKVLEQIPTHGAEIKFKSPTDADFLVLASIRGDKTLARSLILHGLNIDAKKFFDGATALHEVARVKLASMAKWLLSQNAKIDTVDKKGSTALHTAADSNAVEIASLLINKGAFINATDLRGRTALFAACSAESRGLLELLLEKGADVNVLAKTSKCHANELYETPLSIAVAKKNIDAARLLLENGANVDAIVLETFSILNLAVLKGDSKLVELILRFRPSLGLQHNKAALGWAIFVFKIELVDMLIEYGYLLDSKDLEWLLRRAISLDKLAVFEKFVDEFVNVGYAENCGPSSHSAYQSSLSNLLLFAIEQSAVSITSFLLQKGASANVRSRISNATPLMIAVKTNSLDNIYCLLKSGANVNTVDKKGKTALHFAARLGFSDMVEILLQNGANVNAKCCHDRTPIFKSSSDNVTKILLSQGARSDFNDADGNTVLHFASSRGHLKIVDLILRRGLDVNVRNGSNETPLILAVYNGRLDIVEFLMKFGARIDVIDDNGKSPLYAFISFDYGYGDPRSFLVERRKTRLLRCLLEYDLSTNIALISTMVAQSLEDLIEDPLDNYISSSAAVLLDHACKVFYLGIKERKKTVSDVVDYSLVHEVALSAGVNTVKDYEAEVKCLQNETIGNFNTTFYEILTKSARQLSYLARNDEFVGNLQLYDIASKFPHYGSMLKCQIQKGLERRYLLDQAEKFVRSHFEELSQFLDILPKDFILDYLSNQDIIMLDSSIKLNLK